MELVNKEYLIDGRPATLLQKSGDIGLFLFRNGSKYCFNVNGLGVIRVGA